MSNKAMFITYATQMVKMANKTAVVGLIGSGLSTTQIRKAVKQIQTNTNHKFKNVTIKKDVAVSFS